MAKKPLTQQALAAQVVARQQFVEDVIGYVSSLLAKRGKVLMHEVHDYHTRSTVELRGYTDFSFYSEGVYSMYGGEKIRLWYHPGKPRPVEPTLVVEWWDVKKCKVLRFDPTIPWQRALKRLIKDHKGKQQIAAREEAKERRATERAAKQAEREAVQRRIESQLAAETKRLCIAA